MKKLFAHIVPLLLLLLNSCEVEHVVECFPVRVKTTLVSGTTVQITADYKYENDTLYRIVWSNSQTHYFSYNDVSQLIKVEEYDVKTLLKFEYRIAYDGNQVARIDRYLSRLDFETQMELDTTFVGYRIFVHEGGFISEEEVYEKNIETGEFYLKFKNNYTYDISGNILSFISNDIMNGSVADSLSFSYDQFKNPYNALNLYFNGESFVNNILSKKDLINGDSYTYLIIMNASNYPEQIIVRENGNLFQSTSFEYTCK